MIKLFLFLLLLPFIGQAHPGVGIVRDSKGNIYYTDLHRVWKITNAGKTVVVPDVHTHELYVDKYDNLYGEGGYYDDQAVKFYHYQWVYRPNGKIDTVVGMKEQYFRQDFSLARDKNGNEYYLKRFLIPHTDTTHLYRKSPEGVETVFAKGNFKNVNWLHPQDDGSLFYVSNNAVYKVEPSGIINLVKEQVGSAKPTFKFAGNDIRSWGVWQDSAKNIYTAVFTDQTVKKIDPAGNLTDIYKSKGNWAPLHGVFDDHNNLWVLECSDKNEVRVTLVETTPIAHPKANSNLLTYALIACIVLVVAVIYLKCKSIRSITLSRLKS